MFADMLTSALTTQEVVKGEHDTHNRSRIHWLRNMKLDEISLVSAGANRRRFTIMKAAGEPDDPFQALERALNEWLSA